MNNDKTYKELYELGYATIRSLETKNGILASGRKEIYGCVFGRDSLITALKLIRVYRVNKDEYLAFLVRKIITSLAGLQGTEVNIESGEAPGKIIHEYRPKNHDHLTQDLVKPWYVYPDGKMRIFDSVDSTPLFLMAIHNYVLATGDKELLSEIMPSALSAIRWLTEYSDKNNDGFVDYGIPPERMHGGLIVQSWMDSVESLFHEDGSEVTFPVAPVEVQAYTYSALSMWSGLLKETDPTLSTKLKERAVNLQSLFNQKYVLGTPDDFSLASAVDGAGKPIASVRSSMGHVLWAVSPDTTTGKIDCILDEQYIPLLVKRLLRPDMFVENAGIRTLSDLSSAYTPQSYHNGSLWPHDNSIIIEGLENFGYKKEADNVRRALMNTFEHFNTPIELFVYDQNGFSEYRELSGQGACREQAWSAAAMVADSLAMLKECDSN